MHIYGHSAVDISALQIVESCSNLKAPPFASPGIRCFAPSVRTKEHVQGK